jgi:hypothetical protein
MAYVIDTTHTKAILIGAGNFPKDHEMATLPTVRESFEAFADVLSEPQLFNIPPMQVVKLLNTPDNTVIKEQLSAVAEQTQGVLFIYFSGNIVMRKGQLYFATEQSSKQLIHVNGLSFAEFLSIVRETEAVLKIILLDVNYHKLSTGEFTEEDINIVKNELSKIEQELSGTVLLASMPQDNIPFANVITNLFVTLLRNGLNIEEEYLNINQLFDTLTESVKKAGTTPLPYRSNPNTISDKKIAYNKKYIAFSSLCADAENLFNQEDYNAALDLYQQAATFFAGNQDVNKKIEFIKQYQVANQYLNTGKYEQAISAYHAATAIIPLASIAVKMNQAKEKLADLYYAAENFEQAKPIYDELHSAYPDNSTFTIRLKKCHDEITFFELIDEGDKFYFENNFDRAFEVYKKALSIKYDHKTHRRKLECERFLEREKALREKISEALRREIEDKYKAELESKLATSGYLAGAIPQQDEAQLSVKISEEINKKIEDTFWTKLSIRNDIESYKMYLDIFTNGAYIEKAKQRIAELELIQTTAKQETALNNTISKTGTVEKPRIRLGEQLKAVEKITESNFQDDLPPLTPSEQSELAVPPITIPEVQTQPTEIPKVETPKIQEEIKEEAIQPTSPDNNIVAKEVVYQYSVADIIPPKKQPKIEEVKTAVVLEGFTPGMSEEALWAAAQNAATIEAYTYYIENTKDAAHIIDAYYMINKLNKEQATSETSAADTIIREINSFTGSNYQYGTTTKTVVEPKETVFKDDTTKYDAKPYESTPYKNSADELDKMVQKYAGISVPKEESKPITTSPTHASSKDNVATEDAEEKLWEAATKDNTLSAYYNYINNTTLKKYWNQAKDRIKDLKDAAKNTEEADWVATQKIDNVEAYRNYVRKYPLGNHYAQAMFRINEIGQG